MSKLLCFYGGLAAFMRMVSLSDCGPGEGKLRLLPSLKLSTAYNCNLILRKCSPCTCIVESIIISVTKAIHCLCCSVVLESTPVRYFSAERQTAEDRTEYSGV